MILSVRVIYKSQLEFIYISQLEFIYISQLEVILGKVIFRNPLESYF